MESNLFRRVAKAFTCDSLVVNFGVDYKAILQDDFVFKYWTRQMSVCSLWTFVDQSTVMPSGLMWRDRMINSVRTLHSDYGTGSKYRALVDKHCLYFGWALK
jgi:hypothetical protein